ncbi:MAG: hypothetical protein ACLRP3_08180 [Escherichia sp.]
MDQFKNIIVKNDPDGSAVEPYKDVARVEMGSEDYTAIGKLNDHRLPGLL